MNLIQILLLAGLIVIGVYVYRKLKTSAVELLVISGGLVTGMVFVVFPSITNKVAHLVGVGRGADLIFYLFILIFLFIIVKVYARIRRVEQKLNAIIQQEAMSKVSRPLVTEKKEL